jgi:hypothetical protein
MTTPVIQNLTPSPMTAAQFNSLFTPLTGSPALTQNYTFLNTPAAGAVESQVFQGTGAAQGLYAYAYQFGVNNVSDSTGQPTFVNSASMIFNATPVGTKFTGPLTYGYTITNGQVGALNLPQAAPGMGVQIPSSLAWQPGTKTGSLTFQYLDPTSNSSPLAAGATSGTVVVISTQAPTTQYVSLQNPNPQSGTPPIAYSPLPGTIQQVPAPEPATVLGWTAMIGVLAVASRARRSRKATA